MRFGCSTGILGNKSIDSWPTAGLKNSSKPSAAYAEFLPPTLPPPCARRWPTASTWWPPKPPTSPPNCPPRTSSPTSCAPSTVSSKTPSNAIRNVGPRTPSPGRSRISAIATRPPSCVAPFTSRWRRCGAARRTPPAPCAASACWPFPPAPISPANRCCATWSTPSPNPPPPCAPTPPAPSPKCRATRAPCCSASPAQVRKPLTALERPDPPPFVRQSLAAADQVAEEAALALGGSRQSDAVDVLLESWPTARGLEYRQALLRALSISRHDRAIEFLKHLAAEGRPQDAADARAALELFPDKHAL